METNNEGKYLGLIVKAENKNKFDVFINGGIIYPLGWSIHATFGAFFIAGCTGVFTSLLMKPPIVDSLKEVKPSGE